MFDVTEHLHGLRCRPTSWLTARRDELVREQRRLHVEELAVTRVLDERGALDESVAARDGVSERVVRETVETARALESLPRIAAAAHAGDLSDEQLGSVAVLADEATDTEWAERAPNIAPVDLQKLVRTQSKPTVEDSHARREARFFRMWWEPGHGMLNLRGALPDLDGARFEGTINELIEQMKPAKGQVWDTSDHCGADALMQLCDQVSSDERDEGRERDHVPTLAAKPLVVVQVPPRGPATVAGIPLPDAVVEQLRASATMEPVLVDDYGAPLVVGRRFSALSTKITRSILLRDGHCRWPGCERRTGLQIHHLVPRSLGGTDELANLAAVCTGGATDHHTKLVPHGRWALVGNPNRPDGLRLVRYDQLTDQEAAEHGLPPPGNRPIRT